MPSNSKQPIHPATVIGAVALTVADLNRSLSFYQHTLGFSLFARQGDTLLLGADHPAPDRLPLLQLVERRGARKIPGTTGLYHFAVLMPSRLELGRALRRLAEAHQPVEGSADHLVSEALYLSDPDGNGIELYRDRPRREWPRNDQGRLRMGTEPLDLKSLLAELEGSDVPHNGLHPDTVIGHVHLQVARLSQAEMFYRDVLGFDLMARYGPSAAFLAAGGYHHHIGLNTWAGTDLPPSPPDAVGLRWFQLLLPGQDALEAVTARVQAAGLSLEEREDGFLVRDPSGNGLLLTTRALARRALTASSTLAAS